MDTLLNMDTVSSDRHLQDLRWLYDYTASHVHSLKSLGIEATSYGALLSPILLSKLPLELRLTHHIRTDMVGHLQPKPSGVWGHAPPENVLIFRCSEMYSGCILVPGDRCPERKIHLQEYMHSHNSSIISIR